MDARIRRQGTAALAGNRSLTREATLVFLSVALLSVSAQVRLPLPFTPVPVTGQTLAVLFLGASLGSRLAVASVGCYWLAGACGLPVFNGGGSGWAIVSGPTGGYLIGFAAAAFVVGWLVERGWDRGASLVVVLLVGEALIYVFGLPWLALFVGPRDVLQAGLVPFIPGDLVKVAAAAAALSGGSSAMRRLSAN